ncbi:hypothetical protein J7400_12860 [Shimia sp. R9_2]|uniref:hypothetical protein n=1 Tax=Shimia sp. R9_2 TaxID=2821112 RepID=UPI001ADB7474|nr:hypothetical protein [Shimia sp. R9_2]MBO9397571.1 hypothetical protein [Shimia sp. R9_2]
MFLGFRSLPQAFACVMLIGLGGAASSQNMTASEAAALSERPPTPAEQTRKTEECQINTAPDEKHDPIPIKAGYEGHVVQLPPMRGILLSWIAYEGPEKGTFALVPPVALPFGGIASFDFCDVVTLIETRAVEKRGDALRYLTLRLRTGLDLEAAYPTAHSMIMEKRLIFSAPPSRYVEVPTDEPNKFVEWLEANKQELPWLHIPYPIIALSDRVFIPTQ